MDRERCTRRAWLQAGAATVAMLALAACNQATATTNAAVTAAGTGMLEAATKQTSTTAGDTTSTTAAVTTISTTTTPISAATTSTAASTSGSTASAPLTATTSTAVSMATSSSVSPTVTETTAASAPAAGVKLTLDAGGSQASYQVQEQLAGKSLPSAAIGRTSAVSGSILFDAAGKIIPAQSQFTIDLRTLKSDQGMRDKYIQHDPLETARYPNATFAPTTTSGMPWPLPASGTATFHLAGNFTVHGATKPITWAVTATFAPDKVTGNATTPFTFSEFGMQAPHTMIALSVQNNGTWTMQFTATHTSG